ncbi:MAG: SCP2 sterol-binding domain-containing protein [Magnetococcales bacterium]|nr:SCP2 sterol-binding domain-containing protein [Magnetococcales bacterium]
MFLSSLTTPLKIIPQPMTAVSLGIILNVFFKHNPDLMERMSELADKVFQFDVFDLEQDYYMLVDHDGAVRIHTYSDSMPNVTMAGKSDAFIALLFQTEDPDSLFFSRKLELSGETDTGLLFKNILDNVDIDWDKELKQVFTPLMGGVLARMLRKAQSVKNASKEKTEERMEAWIDSQEVPRRGTMADIQKQAEALADAADKLERRVTRVGNKLAVERAESVQDAVDEADDASGSDASQSKSEAGDRDVGQS